MAHYLCHAKGSELRKIKIAKYFLCQCNLTLLFLDHHFFHPNLKCQITTFGLHWHLSL
uniref:Uncharacterized protein n=1 Tax=Anguilla anguilla TaxID=7936 RepID=A0A0E9U7W5_ANGAN